MQAPIDRLNNLPAGAICVGHRGARAFAPENTLPAIEKAAQLGCSMVEIYVHLSRDDELVVHHDDRLHRCTDVRTRFPNHAEGFVSDLTLEELRRLDAGSWYVREIALPPPLRQPFLRTLSDQEIGTYAAGAAQLYGTGAITIPTLAEALALAQRLGIWLNIEIKTIPRMYPGIAEKVVDAVYRQAMQSRVLISSFDHEQLVAVRRRSALLATGALSSDRLARPSKYLALLDADAYHPGCYDEFDSLGFGSVQGQVDPRGIVDVRNAGRRVFAWTCNQSSQMRALIQAGVNGIITDYPNRFPSELRAASA